MLAQNNISLKLFEEEQIPQQLKSMQEEKMKHIMKCDIYLGNLQNGKNFQRGNYHNFQRP